MTVIIIYLVIYYVSTTIPQTVAPDSSVPLLPFPVPECITLLSLHSSFVNESVMTLVSIYSQILSWGLGTFSAKAVRKLRKTR